MREYKVAVTTAKHDEVSFEMFQSINAQAYNYIYRKCVLSGIKDKDFVFARIKSEVSNLHDLEAVVQSFNDYLVSVGIMNVETVITPTTSLDPLVVVYGEGHEDEVVKLLSEEIPRCNFNVSKEMAQTAVDFVRFNCMKLLTDGKKLKPSLAVMVRNSLGEAAMAHLQ